MKELNCPKCGKPITEKDFIYITKSGTISCTCSFDQEFMEFYIVNIQKKLKEMTSRKEVLNVAKNN